MAQKIVINADYGGFSLSPVAIRRLAELDGRECYFFKQNHSHEGRWLYASYEPITIEEATTASIFSAFDVSNITELIPPNNWHDMSAAEKERWDSVYKQHSLPGRAIQRDDPQLVKVIEELGAAANGKCAELKIVEIPDGVQWNIEEYDGLEHIAEDHRTWG